MKHAFLTAAVMLMASPAFAGTTQAVPEMDGGAGVAAIALLVGAAALIRERSRRK